ncbi:MAG TPA: response regulator [Terriglobia bacterium]|nr:response regulator [Terriglobia bacterium]
MSRKVCRDSVLVIDDDPDFRALVETMAELYEVPMLQAPDCRKGLKVLEREYSRIKMVFLDYFMPGMEPVRCAAAIIAKTGSSVPVVLMTAAVNPGARAAELKITRWISKPVEASVLKDLLCSGGA